MPAKGNESRKFARDDESRKFARDDESRKLARGGFEDRLERLESLAEKLREGKIPLEEAIALFEEGMKLAKSLEKDLSRLERKVEILTKDPVEVGETPSLALFPELSQEDQDQSQP